MPSTEYRLSVSRKVMPRRLPCKAPSSATKARTLRRAMPPTSMLVEGRRQRGPAGAVGGHHRHGEAQAVDVDSGALQRRDR